MARSESVATAIGAVKIVFTDRSDGDFAVASPAAALDQRRRSIIDHPWTWLRQVHGPEVVHVETPGQWAGTEADGALTSTPGCPIAIMTADCAPVVFVSEAGVAVVHAGWKGIVSGVISQAVTQLRSLHGEPVATLLGPCINPGAYEFGADDLRAATDLFGSDVEGRTAWDTPALDVPQAVAIACEKAGWPPPAIAVPCTSGDDWFSHRTRTDTGRQATVAWIEAAPASASGVRIGSAPDVD